MPAVAAPSWNPKLESNRTAREFPTDATLTDLFERQVEFHSTRAAVSCAHDPFWVTHTLTFGELNEKANQVARCLRDLDIGPGDIVGVLVERSFAMVIGLFGILKAGAAYLPLSPDDPTERLAYVLGDAKAKLLLVQHATMAKAPAGFAALDLESSELYRGPATNLGRTCQPDDLAYVIYTSGSTGRPKGVMIEHRSVVNRLHWMQHAYPIGANDVLLQKTPYCFDVSVWELFWWALEGSKLTILPPRGERVPQTILEVVRRDLVTAMHFVPSMLNVFLEHLAGRPEEVAYSLGTVRRIFTSGEALSPAHVQKFNAIIGRVTGCHLINLYGPTEATVDATYFDCPPGKDLDRVPIGRPIQNMEAHIVHENRLADAGEIGELLLSGVGLARGYLNNPELTQAKFGSHPALPGVRVYRTGDLARQLPDGNIEYLGREDSQVKIRGLRVELEEIENQLRRIHGIADCVVAVKQFSESIVLIVAYCVTDAPLDADTLKRHLRQQLPEYMIPNRFERIPAIPLTSSGKADRKALPDPSAHCRTVEVPSPASATTQNPFAIGAPLRA